MNVIWISNKLFMFSLILLMIVFIWHGFGWKRLLVWRRITDRSQSGTDPNETRMLAEDAKQDMRHDDVRLISVLRNPFFWVALAGIAVSILITL
jgi:hypothetical protein